jgi:glycosyltransferase involved in cell wall biosynthesis
VSKNGVTRVVFSGHPLKHRNRGLGVLAARLFRAHLRLADEFPATVLIPGNLQGEVDQVPPEMARILPGKPFSRRLVLEDAYWQHQMARTVREEYPDSIFMALFHFATVLSLPNGIAFIPDIIYRQFPEKSLPRRLYYRLTERFAAKARAVLTISEHAKSEIVRLRLVREEKVHVLYPWIEDAFVRRAAATDLAALRAKYQLPDTYWLYIGGFDSHKNVEFLLTAYAAASGKTAVPDLVLAGAIPPEGLPGKSPVYQTLRTMGPSASKVRLPGVIADDDLPGLYAAAALTIYPSRYEGFGYPPAESMAVGTPVLAADATSLKEVVPDRHSRFTLTDPRELTDKLIIATRSPRDFTHPLPPCISEETGVKHYAQILRAAGNCSP